MTEEDKKLISKYMGWIYGQTIFHVTMTDTYIEPERAFDLNDAGLCVQEMQKRGEWDEFVTFVEETPENRELCITWSQFIAWLFNAENFFAAMSQWLREGK